jgi:hypothetical protein
VEWKLGRFLGFFFYSVSGIPVTGAKCISFIIRNLKYTPAIEDPEYKMNPESVAFCHWNPIVKTTF